MDSRPNRLHDGETETDMARGAYAPKIKKSALLNGADVGDKLLSVTHGVLKIIRIEPEEHGLCCVVCKTRGGDEIDLSAAYAGKLAVL